MIKQMMKTSSIGSALAIAGVLAFSGNVMGDQVTATLDDIDPTSPGGGGLFYFDDASGPILFYNSDSFVSFCIDLDENVSTNNTYTWDVVALGDAPNGSPMGTDKAADLAKLYGDQIGTSLNDATTLNDGTLIALQLATWEIIYEDFDANGYSVSGGNHFVGNNSGWADDANDMLSDLGDSGVVMTGLVALTNEGAQDFVAQVPIPAAAWLFGSAMVGAGVLGRRKKKADATAA